MTKVVVLDNGSFTVKVGVAGEKSPRYVGPNCTARLDRQLRVLVADDISSIRNQSLLKYTRPFERGQLTNVGCESEVWNHVFSRESIACDESTLLVSEAPLTPSSLAQSLDELIFEEFQFAAACRCPSSCLAAVAAAASPTTETLGASHSSLPPETPLVVDCGYSCTHVSPVYGGELLVNSVRRHAFGGKALTGYLRELASYRQYNVMDETALLDDVKHKLLFVSEDFDADLRLCDDTDAKDGGPLCAEYELPDYTSVPGGGGGRESLFGDARGDPQATKNVLRVESERFAVPEILFSPRDVGCDQAGLADLVIDAILASHPALRQPLASNVVLCGGTAKLPGLEARLYLELRKGLPAYLDLNVRTLDEPDLAVFRGAALAATLPNFIDHCTTREAYLESGGQRY